MITVGLASFAKPNNSTRVAAASNFTSYNGVLVEPCSIMKPLIKFEGISAWDYNYAYISQFGRYYFIDDYYTENGFWFAQMTVDVLASFKTTIGSSTQYIERAANKQNAYALDMFYPTTGDYSQTTYDTSGGIVDQFSDGVFAINVNGSANDIVATYMCTYDNFKKVIKALFAWGSDNSSWGGLSQGIANSLFDPMQHIGSVIWFPFCWWMSDWAVGSNAVHQLTIGLWNLGPGTGDDAFTLYKVDKVQTASKSYTVAKHPQAATYGKYMNLSPYTRYMYKDPVHGDIVLDNSVLIDSNTMTIAKHTDVTTGQQLLVLPDNQTRIGQAGFLVPMENNSVNVGGILSNAVQAVKGFVTKDPFEAIAGTVGAVTDFLPHVTSTISQSGSMTSYSIKEKIIAQFWKTTTQYPARFGKLYCTQAAINTVSGYVKCKDAHWQNNKAFADEIQMVEAYMNGGMFYE